jgi:hypothetical protein
MPEEHVALEEAIAMASRLAPEERMKLRAAIDQMTGAPAEDDNKEMLFKRLLMNKGLISQIRLPQTGAAPSERHPVTVKGKPVSETIIEDRG